MVDRIDWPTIRVRVATLLHALAVPAWLWGGRDRTLLIVNPGGDPPGSWFALAWPAAPAGLPADTVADYLDLLRLRVAAARATRRATPLVTADTVRDRLMAAADTACLTAGLTTWTWLTPAPDQLTLVVPVDTRILSLTWSVPTVVDSDTLDAYAAVLVDRVHHGVAAARASAASPTPGDPPHSA